jgi:hypothetical protein
MITVVTIAGVLIGKAMRQKISSSEYPSIFAASNRSCGSRLKKFSKMKMVSGSCAAM